MSSSTSSTNRGARRAFLAPGLRARVGGRAGAPAQITFNTAADSTVAVGGLLSASASSDLASLLGEGSPRYRGYIVVRSDSPVLELGALRGKRFGFVTPEDGSKDCFVHHSAIQGEGYQSLADKHEAEFRPGCRAVFTGKAKQFRGSWQLEQPHGFALDGPEAATLSKLMPVYPLTAKLYTWDIQKVVTAALDLVTGVPDVFTPELRARFEVLDVMQALRWKQAFSDRTDAEMAIVTQFCFEAGPTFVNYWFTIGSGRVGRGCGPGAASTCPPSNRIRSTAMQARASTIRTTWPPAPSSRRSLAPGRGAWRRRGSRPACPPTGRRGSS